MNDMLTYKDYTGSVHYSAADNVFFGKVEGINDLITFEGKTEQELKDAFHYMIDEHVRVKSLSVI
jgi:predicted HicB family RNase H-like nuclease